MVLDGESARALYHDARERGAAVERRGADFGYALRQRNVFELLAAVKGVSTDYIHGQFGIAVYNRAPEFLMSFGSTEPSMVVPPTVR